MRGRSRARRPGPTSALAGRGARAGRRRYRRSGCSGSSQSGRPDSLTRPWATSTRKPSTPRSSQNRSTSSNSARTCGLLPVEVGLLGVEQVQVPLAPGFRSSASGDPGPGRTAEDALPVVRRQLAARAHGRRGRGSARARGCPGRPPARPGTTRAGRSVVRHEVDDDLDAEVVRGGEQGVGVGQRAEEGVDVAVVGDVVAGVGLGRGVERGEPDGVHAEVAQVGQAGRDARQVADAVTVAVGPRARVDLVDHGVAPPRRVQS